MSATATATLNPTKNDLSISIREQMVELLQSRLADAGDLQFQAKQAHWNVKGPNFIAVHELFDQAADEIRGYVDDIAERLVQLGGVAKGRVQDAAAGTTLPPYPTDITAAADHIDAFSTALAAFGKNVRQAIDSADAAGDQDTADLFTGISRGVDKTLWFVEAHNQ